MLTDRRNSKAARRFLGKALKQRRHWPPFSITSDRNPGARRHHVLRAEPASAGYCPPRPSRPHTRTQ